MVAAVKRFIHNEYTFSKFLQKIYTSGALICVCVFAAWWFDPFHIPQNFSGWYHLFDILLFLLVSYIIWHPIIMEVLTWTISSHIKPLRVQKPIPGMKVAFITTIVPKNEPTALLHKCLPAMVKAKYPHDTWLLDEGDNDEVKKICMQYGVFHFSRFGNERLNTKTGKYTKTKGGNHNSWYDTYGNNYDIVAQIDTDFVPKSTFLTKTLGFFKDPKVAFVGTPQVYGNTNDSLVAKGAAEQQFNFYGAVLQGLSGMGMTLLIGANHVIRVNPFRIVGHYTAHITEDLITGMKLHAYGFKSVYVPYPLAVGEGPSSWESYFNQQLRWAYGCMDILFKHSRKYFKHMPFRQVVYYFFLQQHYFSGLVMALSLVLLTLYFAFGWRSANVDTFAFLLFYSVILSINWLVSIFMQRFNIERNRRGDLQIAGKIVSIAAWPVWFQAFITVLTGRKLTYKVTPKGDKDAYAAQRSLFIPHFVFAAIALFGIVLSFFTHTTSAVMYFWAVSSMLLMITVPFADELTSSFTRLYSRCSRTFTKTFHPAVKVGFEEHEILHDSIFLGFIYGLSLYSYITRIGFYSDDWSFLGNFALTKPQTFTALLQTATTPNTFMRPMQNIYDVVLYLLFGTNALGYQVVNAGVFLIILLLLYRILRFIGINRIITLAIVVIFSLLPNYATDRFWYAAFQINLSVAFFLFSSYAGIRAFASGYAKSTVWQVVSVICLILSILSYEVILPFVFLNAILFFVSAKKKNAQTVLPVRRQNPAIFITLTGITLLYLVIFKVKTTIRLGSFNYPGDIAFLLVSIVHTNFYSLGIRLPTVFRDIITHDMNALFLYLAGLIFLSIFCYLLAVFHDAKPTLPGFSGMRNLVISGLFLFFLGYSIFFTNNKVGFSPTGIDNRVAIAASIGIAVLCVGVIGFICRLLPRLLGSFIFSLCIALFATGGFLIISTIATYWGTAYQKDRAVLATIKATYPVLPKNSTLLLDGVCPYVGPGIVFESQWDLKGALQTIYHDPTVQADIVTPRLKLGNTSIDTQIYTFKAYYPYRKLLIFNVKKRIVYPVSNEQQAITYFKANNPDYNNGCPPSLAGNGVSVFN